MQRTGVKSDIGVDRSDSEATALEQGQRIQRLRRRSTVDPDHHVDDLRQVDRADRHGLGSFSKLALDFGRRGLVQQESDQRLRIEDRQGRDPLRMAASDSSRRVWRRTSSELVAATSGRRSAPRAAPIGSSGSGRKTNSLPRSSMRSRRVPHRCRTSAGMET